MHELSIAMSIVELAVEEAKKAEASSISRIEVEIGTMAGIEAEALMFAWDAAKAGTIAGDAALIINTVSAEGHCLECGKDFPVDNFFTECPSCKGFRYNINKGKELRVSSLIVD